MNHIASFNVPIESTTISSSTYDTPILSRTSKSNIYFEKIWGVGKAICKYCQKIYPFWKNYDHLKRYYEKVHSPNQSQQIHISTYGGNIKTYI